MVIISAILLITFWYYHALYKMDNRNLLGEYTIPANANSVSIPFQNVHEDFLTLDIITPNPIASPQDFAHLYDGTTITISGVKNNKILSHMSLKQTSGSTAFSSIYHGPSDGIASININFYPSLSTEFDRLDVSLDETVTSLTRPLKLQLYYRSYVNGPAPRPK